MYLLSQSGKKLVQVNEVTMTNNDIWVYPGPSTIATYASEKECIDVIEQIRGAIEKGNPTFVMPPMLGDE
jgi:hypothetical protein